MPGPYILFFADLHVGPRDTHGAHNDSLLEFFTFLAKSSNVGTGDVIVFLGDNVDSPSKDAYAELRNVVAPFIDTKIKMMFVEGNHDNAVKGLFWSVWGEDLFDKFKRNVGAAPRKLEVGNCVLLAVDTTLHTIMPTDMAQGRVGSRQLAWLDREFKEAINRGLIAIPVMHHDPFNTTFATEGLLDKDKLIQLLRRNRVQYNLSGHSHDQKTNYVRFDHIPGDKIKGTMYYNLRNLKAENWGAYQPSLWKKMVGMLNAGEVINACTGEPIDELSDLIPSELPLSEEAAKNAVLKALGLRE